MTKELYKVSNASISFTGGLWEEIPLSAIEKIYKPTYMVSSLDWKDLSEIKKNRMPFIRVSYTGKDIVSIEASPGGVRELPIFYTVTNGSLKVSDNPKKLAQGGSNFDELSINEFMSFGYVTSNRTLFKNIFSLEAGSLLTFNQGLVNVSLEYIYNSMPVAKHSYHDLMDQLWGVSEAVFNDLIKAIQGKTVILPLSSGYDSRFIASMLKLGGFENVQCFAWGNPGNKDIEISRQVAKKLGYQWDAIDFSEKNWQKIINQVWVCPLLIESANYVSTSGAASLPFQDYLQKLDIENSVLLPGHTGDFIGGGHLPITLTMNATAHDICQFIIKKHSLANSTQENRIIRMELDKQINSLDQRMETYRIFEAWEQRERQAKFIANTNRYYESLKVGWNMPLWSSYFVDFWDTIPLDYKKNNKLYNDFVINKIFYKLGVNFGLKNKTKSIIQRLRWLKRFKIVNEIKSLIVNSFSNTDEFGFYLALPYLYNKTQKDCPKGFQLMNDYCQRFGYQKPEKQYEFLSRSVLAMTFEASFLA